VALLVAFGAAGLFAVHRMVSVAVGFAERRSNFVAAVTHELKTPLTAIRMYAEMLRDGLVPSDDKRGEYYRTITDESERLSRLIDNVLEFARLERGSRELQLRAGDIVPVLEEALAKLRSHASRQGFELVLAADPSLPPVLFDRDALLQVLFNLVDNAMKYARGAGDRSVRIEARRAGEGVEVAVRDFGPGVGAQHAGHGHRSCAGARAGRAHGRVGERRQRAGRRLPRQPGISRRTGGVGGFRIIASSSRRISVRSARSSAVRRGNSCSSSHALTSPQNDSFCSWKRSAIQPESGASNSSTAAAQPPASSYASTASTIQQSGAIARPVSSL
jgi:hypothetical protein